jgi:glycosyltransferase involved in cell wall biosynthesis
MREPITVAHLITSLDVGGSELVLYRLVTAMQAHGFRHRVAVLKPAGPVAAMLESAGVEVHSFELRHLGGVASAGRRLSRWLRDVRPDVFQTWLYHADFIGLLASGLAGYRRLVWNVRTADDERLYRPSTRFVRWACARTSRMPAAVVANSQTGLAFHKRLGYRPRQWTVIPNGVDTEAFTPNRGARLEVRDELGVARDAPLVGLVARLDPIKGHETFLAAAGRLARVRPDVHFVLVGPGVTADAAPLATAIARDGLQRRVHLLGSRQDVARLTAALDVATLCSVTEGAPNVVLEALACGVPCVVTGAGDAADLVGDAGSVVSRDGDEVARAWLEWLERGPEERQRVGITARESIIRRFSLNAAVRAYERLYAAVAADGTPGRAWT